MRITVCDKCGTKVDAANIGSKDSARHLEVNDACGNIPKDIDLCTKCYSFLVKWLNSLAEEAGEDSSHG